MSKLAVIPASNGYPVTTRQFSWLDMVVRAWGAEWAQPDHGVYEWPNGRKFDSSDMYKSGIYGVQVDTETSAILTDEYDQPITDDQYQDIQTP